MNLIAYQLFIPWLNVAILNKNKGRDVNLNHLNIQTNKIEQTVSFYCDLIGLKKGARPNFNFEGAWLCDERGPIIHIMPKFGQDSVPNFLGHIAFSGDDLKGFLELLAEKKVDYEKRVLPDSRETQVFIKDPNNITVEIQFLNQ